MKNTAAPPAAPAVGDPGDSPGPVGTPLWMAPEILTGHVAADESADVYVRISFFFVSFLLDLFLFIFHFSFFVCFV